MRGGGRLSADTDNNGETDDGGVRQRRGREGEIKKEGEHEAVL